MDPLSIAVGALSLAGSLWKASETISSFVKASTNVDRSVKSLHSQANGLASVLKSLGTTLKHPSLAQLAQDNQEFWHQVAESIQSCRTTTDELAASLDRLPDPSSNQVKQAWRQFKLGTSQHNINRLLDAMRTHSVNIQLSVGIINVLLCASTSDTIIDDRASRFERLEAMINAIDVRLQGISHVQISAADGEDGQVVLDNNTLRLRGSAGTIISNATSAAGLSRFSETEPDAEWDISSAFDAFDPFNDNAETIEGSTTGSQFGRPLNDTEKFQIHDWIRAMPAIDGSYESTASSSQPNNASLVFSDHSLTSEIDATEISTDLFDESSEDDTEFQVAQSLVSNASSEFESEQFTSAEKLLKSSLEHCRHLKFKQQEALGFKDMQLRYALCKFRTGKLEESEELFLQAAKQPVRNAPDAKRFFDALHGLATIQLRRHNFEAAENHCRQALKGRRKTRTIGKNHQDYFASLKLYSTILWAQGDTNRTKAYLELLPGTEKLSPSELEAFSKQHYLFVNSHLTKEVSATFIDEPIHDGLSRPDSISNDESLATNSDTPPSRGIQATPSVEQDIVNARNSVPRNSSSTMGPSSSVERDGKLHSDIRTTEIQESIHTREIAPSLESMEESPHRSASLKPIALETSVENCFNLTSTPGELMAAQVRLIQQGYYKPGEAEKGLISAARSGKLAEVNVLLRDLKVNVNTRTGMFGLRATPLTWAASEGRADVCARLLAASASLELPDQYHNTPLTVAVMKRQAAVCKLLLRHGANINGSMKGSNPFFLAATVSGDPEICKLLLLYGADVHRRYLDGLRVLMEAARIGNILTCVFLLNHGAHIEQRDDDGQTALMYAAKGGQLRTCEVLLDHGANLRTKDHRSRTALDHLPERMARIALSRYWEGLHFRTSKPTR